MSRCLIVFGQRMALILVLSGLAATRAPAGFQVLPTSITANEVLELDFGPAADANVPTTTFENPSPQLAWHGHCGAPRTTYYGHYGNSYRTYYGGYGGYSGYTVPYRTYRPVNCGYGYGHGVPYRSYYYRSTYYGPSGYGYGGYPNNGSCRSYRVIW